MKSWYAAAAGRVDRRQFSYSSFPLQCVTDQAGLDLLHFRCDYGILRNFAECLPCSGQTSRLDLDLL